MAVSSGFFNSVNHDRLYDAEQISSIFDGIILDGVYDGYGDSFAVSSNSDADNSIFVNSGRAWFDHTWTLNDSRLVIEVEPPNIMLDRIDAIVIDVDRRESVRKNSILYIAGEASSSPTPPTLIKDELHKQYPIAYITRPAGTEQVVSNKNIENKVGSDECPRVIGVLEALNDDQYYAQLKADFEEWWDGIKDLIEGDSEGSLISIKNDLDELAEKVDNSMINDKGELGNYQVPLTKSMFQGMVNGDYGSNSVSCKSITLNSGTFQMSGDPITGDITKYAYLYNDIDGINEFILPDGYFFSANVYQNSTYSNYRLRFGVNLYTPEGVRTYTLYSSEWSAPYTWGYGCTFVVGDYDASVYPVVIPVAITLCDAGDDVEDSPYDIYSGTVSINEEHVITFNLNHVSKPGGSNQVKNVTSTQSAVLSDGSKIFIFGTYRNENYSNHDGMIYAAKLTPQGTVSIGSGFEPQDGPASTFNAAGYYNSGDYAVFNLGDYTNHQRGTVNINTLEFKVDQSNAVPSTYITTAYGSYETCVPSTGKTYTTSYNKTNNSSKTENEETYPHFVFFDRNRSLPSSEQMILKTENDDGTITLMLPSSAQSGVNKYIANPLTGVCVTLNSFASLSQAIDYSKAYKNSSGHLVDNNKALYLNRSDQNQRVVSGNIAFTVLGVEW